MPYQTLRTVQTYRVMYRIPRRSFTHTGEGYEVLAASATLYSRALHFNPRCTQGKRAANRMTTRLQIQESTVPVRYGASHWPPECDAECRTRLVREGTCQTTSRIGRSTPPRRRHGVFMRRVVVKTRPKIIERSARGQCESRRRQKPREALFLDLHTILPS